MKVTLSLTILAVATALIAAPVSYTPPPETARFKPAAGVEQAMASCLMCHSTEYVSTQPPLPRATWKAIVLKMQKVHGAPIAEPQVDPIVDYLVKAYGDEGKTTK